MDSPPLPAEKQLLFQEAVWRVMGDLQDARWREMLDPAHPLGVAVRAYYVQLLDGPEPTVPLGLFTRAEDITPTRR